MILEWSWLIGTFALGVLLMGIGFKADAESDTFNPGTPFGFIFGTISFLIAVDMFGDGIYAFFDAHVPERTSGFHLATVWLACVLTALGYFALCGGGAVLLTEWLDRRKQGRLRRAEAQHRPARRTAEASNDRGACASSNGLPPASAL